MSTLANAYPYWLGNYTTATSSGNTSIAPYLIKPIGEVTFTASSRNPAGFLTCDGSVFSKSVFPDLALAIGQNYANNTVTVGGTNFSWLSNSQDFAIPNLLNVFPLGGSVLGQDKSNFYSVAIMGGSNRVTLNVSNIPPHEHIQQQGGVTATSGAGARAGDPNVAGPLTQAGIYDSNGTLVTASGATPQAVVLPNPPYSIFNSLIRATYNINPAWQVGYINIDSTNNQFYSPVLTNTAPVTFSNYAVTLSQGYFTPVQMLNNILTSIGSAVATAQGKPCPTTLYQSNSYSISAQGNWVMKAKMNNQGGANAWALGFGFCFSLASNTSGAKPATPNRIIPQSILDATADTLGFVTRNNYGALPASGSFAYNTGYSSYDYIAAPKAFKIYWGSLADNTVVTNTTDIINSF